MKPTDEEILAVLAKRTSMITYHLANCLQRPREQHCGTSWLLRQLKRMEKAGLVQRVKSNYLAQICWAVSSDPKP